VPVAPFAHVFYRRVASYRTNGLLIHSYSQCVLQPRIDERIDGTLEKLPGCNPVVNGPNPAAFVQNCAITGAAGANLILPEGQSIYMQNNIEGWNPVGCARDDLGSRALSTKYENGNMTVKACTSYCSSKGFTFAGLEWAKVRING